MFLSDYTIKGLLGIGDLLISPYDSNNLQPASYDVTLAADLLIPLIPNDLMWNQTLDLRSIPDVHEFMYQHTMNDTYLLKPGSFILGRTMERIKLPRYVRSSVEGKSSLGRLGIAIHITAGYIDPGFEGSITLEIKNNAPWAIRLYTGCKIGQLAFALCDRMVERPYGHPDLGSKYQGQSGVKGSAYGRKILDSL